MKPFEYIEPKSLGEALGLLDQFGREARPLAGGTDLIVQMKQGQRDARYVVNLKKIDDLGSIRCEEGKGLRIGPLSTHFKIISSDVIRRSFNILVQAAQAVGTPQVRNLGTVGGNICNASPSADTLPALLALGAQLQIRSARTERSVPIEQFFVGPYETQLAPNELVIDIEIPPPRAYSACSYAWLPKYMSVDETLVGCGVVLCMNPTSYIIEDVRIGLGAVAPTPMRAVQAENFLKGEKVVDRLLEEGGKIASAESKPVGRFGTSAEFRKEMVRVLVIRCLKKNIHEICEKNMFQNKERPI